MGRLFSVVLLVLFTSSSVSAQSKVGVVVDQVAESSPAWRAGLMWGDVILEWSQGDVAGSFSSPFDFVMLELERGNRGPVRLRGTRRNVEQIWIIEAAPWRAEVLPPGGPRPEQGAGQAGDSPARDGVAGAEWLDVARREEDRSRRAWFLFVAAQAFSRAQRWADFDQALGDAVVDVVSVPSGEIPLRRAWAAGLLQRTQWSDAQAQLEQALEAAKTRDAGGLAEAAVLIDMGRLLLMRQQPANAEPVLRKAHAMVERLAPDSALLAFVLQGIGHALIDSGAIANAMPYHQQALAIYERVAPDSLEVATNLHAVARIAQERGDLDTAETVYRRSLAISENVAPDGPQRATTLNNLGNVLRVQGDLVAAERLLKQALAAQQQLAPEGLSVGMALGNLGIVAQLRGDFVNADALYRESLAVAQRVAPGSIRVANTLNNLGLLAKWRRDLDLADTYLGQSLEIVEKVARGTVFHARAFNNLGTVAEARGNLREAERYYRAALDMRVEQKADDLLIGESLHNIGAIHELRNELAQADDYYDRALAAFRRHSTRSPQIATILHNRGDVARKEGRWDAAEALYGEALEIRLALLPDAAETAESLYALAGVARHRQDVRRAEALLAQALEVVERQAARVGGLEDTRANFRAEFAAYYREYIDLLVQETRHVEAFDALERSRARALLEMIGARDLAFAEVPAELEETRARLTAAYDRTQAELGELDPQRDGTQIAELQGRLRDLMAQRAAVLDQVRSASPHVASLRNPRPLDLAATRAVLDPDTVLLSYVVGSDRTLLFVVQPSGREPAVSVFPIALGETGLRQRVERLREAIEARTPAARQRFASDAASLYVQLLKPAESLIESAARVLVIADGPLHSLPFAALRRPANEYVIEWKPLHYALSATLYADAKTRRGPARDYQLDLAAFGDPSYGNPPDQRMATVPDRVSARALAPLPFSRREADSIANGYGSRARVYLGAQATEEAARSLGPSVRYIHFAVHGLLDHVFPLNSALALAKPGTAGAARENGLLQAWELFETIRWDADLVVLSACETALGDTLAGEGLIGLTQAVQFAGSRAVVASLWVVDDRRTAEFMERFYGYLRAGETTDRALRRTQLDFIRSAATAPPAHWAAFTLSGDWR